jgi:hypothetical protein
MTLLPPFTALRLGAPGSGSPALHSPVKLNELPQTKKPLLFRIYEWPLSYFVGLLIGLVVTFATSFWYSGLREMLQPAGRFLFLSGWVLIIGSYFGTGMDQFIELPPRTGLQKWITRGSVVVGIALNTIAWTFFTLSPETVGDQPGDGKAPSHFEWIDFRD